MENFDYIKRNYISLEEELEALAARLGTPVPTLVCVTKSGSDEELLALAAAGARDIGENRPQELARRHEILRAAGYDARMHEIGTLQRNKIKLIRDIVHSVHSVDSLRLATDLDRHAREAGRQIPILIEVNCAREEQKGGITPEEAEELVAAASELTGLCVSGLMTMGPATDDGELLRPYFRDVKKLFDRLTPYFCNTGAPILSMGMSDSYRTAIEEGATLVRVGRAIFRK